MNGAATAIPLTRQITRSAGQGVSFSISLPGAELDVELVLGQEASPSSLSPIEQGFGGEVLQVMVICEDRELNAMQVHVPLLKTGYDC